MVIKITSETDSRTVLYSLMKILRVFGSVCVYTTNKKVTRMLDGNHDGYVGDINVIYDQEATMDLLAETYGVTKGDFDFLIIDNVDSLTYDLQLVLLSKSETSMFTDEVEEYQDDIKTKFIQMGNFKRKGGKEIKGHDIVVPVEEVEEGIDILQGIGSPAITLQSIEESFALPEFTKYTGKELKLLTREERKDYQIKLKERLALEKKTAKDKAKAVTDFKREERAKGKAAGRKSHAERRKPAISSNAKRTIGPGEEIPVPDRYLDSKKKVVESKTQSLPYLTLDEIDSIEGGEVMVKIDAKAVKVYYDIFKDIVHVDSNNFRKVVTK